MIFVRFLMGMILVSLLWQVSCSRQTEVPVPVPVAEVTTTQVISGEMQSIFRGFGEIEFDPAGETMLVAEIEALVVERKVQPGETITEGDVVLRLGPSSGAGVEIVQARRDAASAEAEAERTKRLRADGLAGDGDVESAETRAKDLKSLAESLERRAETTSASRAPMDGIVEAVFVEPGQLVSQGAQLARIASQELLQARIGVEIDDAARLRPGDKVRLSSLNSKGGTAASSIRRLDHRLDPDTHMVSVLVNVPPDRGFLPGEPVRADFIAGTRPDVVQVPRKCVFMDEEGSYVFVASDGRASLRRVETGITTGEQTEIVSGLSPGETVIVEGAAVLSDGIRIRDSRPTEGGQP